MSFVKNEKNYVVTYKELILTFLVFTLILIVLYPKEIIKEQILSENSNYDLSMLYLNNMLKNDPTNELLMLTLASQSLRSGKKDLAYKLLELLHNSKDLKIRERSYRESYTLAKEDYFYFQHQKDSLKEEEYFKKLEWLFSKIRVQTAFVSQNYNYMYKETIFLKEAKYAYEYAIKELDKTKRIEKLKEVYHVSVSIPDIKNAMKSVSTLYRVDGTHKKEWDSAAYFLVLNYYSKAQAQKFLENKSKKSNFWLQKYAEYSRSKKEYIDSSQLFMKLFKREKSYKLKKRHFMQAVGSLVEAKQEMKAVTLAQEYEEYYFNDTQMRKYFLKLYLANGALQKAATLSKKILVRKSNG